MIKNRICPKCASTNKPKHVWCKNCHTYLGEYVLDVNKLRTNKLLRILEESIYIPIKNEIGSGQI